MTVAAETPLALYDGDGVTTVFPMPWRYLDPSHLMIELINADGVATAKTLNVDYTATAGATDAGGSVTMIIAPLAGQKLRGRRVTPKTQASAYPTAGAFPAKSHELALDRQMMAVQEQDREIADVQLRALQVPFGEVAPQLPAAAARATKFLAFDPVGAPVPATGFGADSGFREDIGSFEAGAGDNLAAARSQWACLRAPPYLKTLSTIRNQGAVSVLACVPDFNEAAVKAGTSDYDIGPILNELLSEMRAAGGGCVKLWPGGRVATSVPIVVQRGCQLLNQGRYSVWNRDNLKPYGLFRIDGAENTDAIVKVERYCSGTLVRGLWLDGSYSTSGDCFAVEGSGTASPDRWNGQAEGLMLTNAKQHGFKVRMGVGGYQFANVYSYNPIGDCYNFADGCEDLQGNFFFGSDATGYGLYNKSSSGRFYQYDMWANNVGIYDDGTNSRHHFFQTDLNLQQGWYIGSGATRHQWIGGTTLSNSQGVPGALPEITIDGNVRGIMICDTIFGTKLATLYPRRAIEYLGTSNKGVVFINCQAERNAFSTGEVFNGQARRWCRIENFTDFSDILGTTPGLRLDFPDAGQNLIANPDLQNGAAGWTNATPIAVAEEANTTIGRCAVLTPTAADSDQFLDYQVLATAQNFRGRRICLSLIYQSPSGNANTKTVGIRIGTNAVQSYNLTAHDATYRNLISEGYTIGSGDSGALVIRIRPKIAGQGGHQEVLRINDVKLRLQ